MMIRSSFTTATRPIAVCRVPSHPMTRRWCDVAKHDEKGIQTTMGESPVSSDRQSARARPRYLRDAIETPDCRNSAWTMRCFTPENPHRMGETADSPVPNGASALQIARDPGWIRAGGPAGGVLGFVLVYQGSASNCGAFFSRAISSGDSQATRIARTQQSHTTSNNGRSCSHARMELSRPSCVDSDGVASRRGVEHALNRFAKI